jgi:hypothetical protein
MELQVFVKPDASARLEYTIVFQNFGQPIDVVDIGLPHENYDIGSMSASINGTPVSGIRKSEYVDVGVEIPLYGRAIGTTAEGTLKFACTMPDMVYQDTTDSNKASLQIVPTWFDPQLQSGTTDLSIVINLPPGVKADEVAWQSDDLAYDSLALVGKDEEQHLAAIWQFPNHSLSANNPKVGISFPKRVMDRVVKTTVIGLFVKWFSESPRVQNMSMFLLFAVTAIWFLRSSGGTGWVVLLCLLFIYYIICGISPALHLILWPINLGILCLVEWKRQRRRGEYLPAIAAVEGGGICRGLTAPQAAVLLELPLGKVLTLVIFGMLKKGILIQTSADPLKVKVHADFRHPTKQRRKAAARRGIVIHEYEQPILDRLVDWVDPVADRDFNDAMGKLIKGVAGRMKGFDLSDTREYYERIVSRAWKEADAIGELKQREKLVDSCFEWMVLDPSYDDRFDTWGRGGYHYRPSWTRSASTGPAPTSTGTPATSRTSFGEVAHSFAGWTENMSNKFASSIEPANLGLDSPSRAGVFDLSGFDRVTSEFLEALKESAGSSGGGGGGGVGGGGGCACACAGCACACACAGGGR